MARSLLAFLVPSFLATVAVLACGGGTSTRDSPSSTGDAGDAGRAEAAADAAPADAAPADAVRADGAPSTDYPAPHPPLPTLVNMAGGRILSTPKIYLIFYPNYQYEAQLQTLAQQIGELPDGGGETSYWTGTTSEYGVGAVQYAGSIVLSGADLPAPSNVTDTQIDSFINQHIASGAFGVPDANTIYTIVYPQTTSITSSGLGSSCSNFSGYHSDTIVNGQDYAYAVIPTCSHAPNGFTGIDEISVSASHEWVEASTDPFHDTAYDTVDESHAVWAMLLGGEAADLCVWVAESYYKDPDVGFTVQRSWSNQLARASHDPCAPREPGVAFFESAPVFPETVSFPVRGGSVSTQGVTISVGSSKTIEVDLFSDEPTSGPWSVRALDAVPNGQPTTLGFQWDRTSGVNGDKLHLTISVTGSTSSSGGIHPFIIESWIGQTLQLWPGLVVE
jgi:hypothetical protein